MPIWPDHHGWKTFADYAFSTQFVPGQLEEKPFVDAVLVPILGMRSCMGSAARRSGNPALTPERCVDGSPDHAGSSPSRPCHGHWWHDDLGGP
eukprot:6224581-Amphidinium_carterae.2